MRKILIHEPSISTLSMILKMHGIHWLGILQQEVAATLCLCGRLQSYLNLLRGFALQTKQELLSMIYQQPYSELSQSIQLACQASVRKLQILHYRR